MFHVINKGGETAEMPGMYKSGIFDLAGFAVGAVNRDYILPKLDMIEEGDVVIGIPSSGVHSNGFSLIRKIISCKGFKLTDRILTNCKSSLAELLLLPTKVYAKCLLPLFKLRYLLAVAHITGGGLLENIPRILPKHLGVELDAKNWKMQPIFQWIMQTGEVLEDEMLQTFNCGLGMVCLIKPKNVNIVLKLLKDFGEPEANVIGKVIKRVNKLVIVNNFNLLLTLPATQSEDTRKRVAVLISGSGTNLQALIDHTQNIDNQSKALITLVISNIENAFGLERAKKAGIETLVLSNKGYKKRADYDMMIHSKLKEHQIELVCLAGFMRILSSDFVNLWKGKLINVHPSLLPSFKGMNSHEQALAAGVRVHGCTVHFVDSEVDTGSIILQEAVPVLINDTPELLQERVKVSEHRIYPICLEYLASGRVSLSSKGKTVWQ